MDKFEHLKTDQNVTSVDGRANANEVGQYFKDSHG